MNRYLIEVSHDPTHEQCTRLANSMAHAGAYYLTRAEWGCDAGIHKSWLIVEALCDEDAELIVPPALRGEATIVRLNRLSYDELRSMGSETPRRELQAAVA